MTRLLLLLSVVAALGGGTASIITNHSQSTAEKWTTAAGLYGFVLVFGAAASDAAGRKK